MDFKTKIINSVVKESFVSFATAKSFDMWIADKKFLNLETKERTDFANLPQQQQQKIRTEYDKYISEKKSEEKAKRRLKPWTQIGETGKPWTLAYLRQWGKQVARDARADFGEIDDTFAFEAAQGAISQYAGLKAYLKSRNIPERAMVSAVADFIV